MSGRQYKMQRHRAGDGGTHWISYSDMMASLLLIFILAIVLSIYNYYQLLETKTRELGEQQAQLDAAQITLAQQEKDLETTRVQLMGKEEELSVIQIQLDTKEQDLNAATLKLSEREEENERLLAQIVLKEADLADQQNRIDALQLILAEQEKELSGYQVQIADLLGVRTRIVEDLRNALARANISATVDPNTGDIVLDSTLMYETNSAVIRAEGLAQLDRLIPIYLNVLLSDEYRDYVAEIMIEGHTDSTGRYERNLELSQERALNVAKYCMSMPGLTERQKELLKKIVTAQGRADSDLVYNADGTENQDRSRRVEIKFRLKDTEMIERMGEILSTLE
ncbi:MAG: OmpA family protein [Clostridia bacterium]|nr:OmpA family protein [Clostridia bacterium]